MKKLSRQQIYSAKTLEALIALCKQHGVNIGFAHHVNNARINKRKGSK